MPLKVITAVTKAMLAKKTHTCIYCGERTMGNKITCPKCYKKIMSRRK